MEKLRQSLVEKNVKLNYKKIVFQNKNPGFKIQDL